MIKFFISVLLYILLNFHLYQIFTLNSTNKYDIIIVGSGLAGLTAAYQSYKLSPDLKILILEKESIMGGNSMRATSGINLLNTPIQKLNNISDSFELFYKDTMISSKNLSNPLLVKALVEGSIDAYIFLTDLGINLSQISALGGHSRARTHRPNTGPVGSVLTSTLINLIKTQTNIDIIINATASELITNKEKNCVYGLKYYKHSDSTKTFEIESKSIIMTSGGFGHDFSSDSLLKEFVPNLLNYPTTNGPQAEGKGLKMVRKLGAELIDMKYVQLHPTGFVDPNDELSKKKILAPELIRGVGGILLNDKGLRFCDELGTRDYVTEKIIEHCKGGYIKALIAINEEGRQEYGKNINFYIGKGFLKEYRNWEQLCEKLNLSKDNVKNTIREYNEFADKGSDIFGKTNFPYKFDFGQKVYAGYITPSIHYTMGGLKINEKTEILKDNVKINGLFGAGEVTGGVHGGNRLGANSLLECVVFGRIAAKSAIYNINNK